MAGRWNWIAVAGHRKQANEAVITILFQTSRYTPDYAKIELRTSEDQWADNPLPGRYDHTFGAWKWELDFARYKKGFECKFFATPFGRGKPDEGWQEGNDNLKFVAETTPVEPGSYKLVDGETYSFAASKVTFPPRTLPFVEMGLAQRILFESVAKPNRRYDVIVIGSGMAGGTLADQLSDFGLNVLVLEAGGLLFPTHIGNLPRPHSDPGGFSKHVWSLWDRFKVTNYDKPQGSDYDGGQGFNLGGRSLFWGGIIPRMTAWELERWPTQVKWDLEDSYYALAEDLMGRSTGPRTIYNRSIHLLLRKLFKELNHADAPMAIRSQFEGANTLPTGMFSTADLLTESLLSKTVGGDNRLEILLNHQAIEVKPGDPAQVTTFAMADNREVTFRARCVVLSAGCFESARLVKRSPGLPQNELVGKGISDHPIYFTHFQIPRDSPYFSPEGNVKTLSQPKKISQEIPIFFNLLLELGSDINQGRYLDEDIWEAHLKARKDYMLCEIVFLFNDELATNNQLDFTGPDMRPMPTIKKSDRSDWMKIAEPFKWKLLLALQAQAVNAPRIVQPIQQNLEAWKKTLATEQAMPGAVAHEVGSLRMRVPKKLKTESGDEQPERPGIVDENLLYIGTDNVYVCDLSVFPTTPAANPSLTAAALAIRLAEHLHGKLKPAITPAI
jgi:hypothetical protein